MTEPADRYTPEQLVVIEAPSGYRSLVDAPAGTGKTHTLAGRLSRLVEHDGLTPGDEVLVLSFSRAAVNELRSRVSGLGGDVQYASAYTFDSFATRVLALSQAGDELQGWGYERRIRAATELLRRVDRPESVNLVKHVLIDELQDLVGARAELVMALLDGHHGGGFTLFGDPAQAIYGHELAGSTDGTTSADLYSWFDNRFATDLWRFGLSVDFRGRTRFSSDIEAIGAELRGACPDHGNVAHRLRSLLLRLPTTTVTSARRMLARDANHVSAVLCRTNAQALRISSELFGLGVEHRYQRRGEDKAAVGWLAQVVSGLESRTTRQHLLDRLVPISEAYDASADELFTLIRQVAPGHGDGLDLVLAAERLKNGFFPEELNASPPSSVVVSTIHRAKGLEFDRVLIVQPQDRDNDDRGAENRLLYVAFSRARRELFHLAAPDTTGLTLDQITGRWKRTGFGPNRWRVFEVEVFGSDVDAVHPAGSWLIEEDPRALQRYLHESVRPGDRVELALLDGDGWTEVPYFVVSHARQPVGVTSEGFGTDLTKILGRDRRPPTSIFGLHVESVDTVAGDAVWAWQSGLDRHGIWNRARVFGLGLLDFAPSSGQGD
jgi:hypothetical protein